MECVVWFAKHVVLVKNSFHVQLKRKPFLDLIHHLLAQYKIIAKMDE